MLYSVLLIRLLLVFIGARPDAGFSKLVYGVTDPFYAPFRRLVSSPTVEGAHRRNPDPGRTVAYALLHFIVRRLLVLVAYRRTQLEA